MTSNSNIKRNYKLEYEEEKLLASYGVKVGRVKKQAKRAKVKDSQYK